ncbi:hypothetical protein [Azorhizophilus paspali]|uniref:Lipoprotein n=1 Tax=Azorhizophilus paspali TaxID=69963 RepID=A0ABV6SN61_AZOPA
MRAWRLALLLPFFLLAGCLVSFTEQIAPGETAPAPLLGEWSRRNEWGERLALEICPVGPARYRARQSLEGADDGLQAEFTVTRHGWRWYLSAGLPDDFGGGFLILGFELTANNELVLYNLEPARVRQALERGILAGKPIVTAWGPGVRVLSPLDRVFAYLDDPANSDVFSEVARYRRVDQ